MRRSLCGGIAVLALLALGIAAWALAGWFVKVPWMTTMLAGRPALSPMTAVAVVSDSADSSVRALPAWKYGAPVLIPRSDGGL